jgi:hypothetical protein
VGGGGCPDRPCLVAQLGDARRRRLGRHLLRFRGFEPSPERPLGRLGDWRPATSPSSPRVVGRRRFYLYLMFAPARSG